MLKITHWCACMYFTFTDYSHIYGTKTTYLHCVLLHNLQVIFLHAMHPQGSVQYIHTYILVYTVHEYISCTDLYFLSIRVIVTLHHFAD